MVKMIRIAFIVIVVLAMNIIFTVKEQKASGKTSEGLFKTAIRALPGFVIAFFVLVLVNTLVKIPTSIAGALATYPAQTVPFTVASLLLTMAIIGICWQCTIQTIKAAGFKALWRGLISFMIQSSLVLALSYAFFSKQVM